MTRFLIISNEKDKMSYFISSLTQSFPDLHRENSAPLSVREVKRHLLVDCPPDQHIRAGGECELKYDIKFFLLLYTMKVYNICYLFPGLILILWIAHDSGDKQTGLAVTDITDFLRVSFHFDYRKAFAARE